LSLLSLSGLSCAKFAKVAALSAGMCASAHSYGEMLLC